MSCSQENRKNWDSAVACMDPNHMGRHNSQQNSNIPHSGWHLIFSLLDLPSVWFPSDPLPSCSIRFLWIPKSCLHLQIASVLMHKSLPVSTISNFYPNSFKKAWIFNVILRRFGFPFFAYCGGNFWVFAILCYTIIWEGLHVHMF